MAATSPAMGTQFSFDTLVSDVNTIVEDLRWLHLELKLRNRLSEVLFQDIDTIEDLLKQGFHGLQQQLGALEFTVYLQQRRTYRIAFRQLEASVFWSSDRMPWMHSIQHWMESRPRTNAPQADVNHYTINGEQVSSIAVPLILQREHVGALLIVAHWSTIVPRLKKLLIGLSGALALALDSMWNRKPLGEMPSHDIELPRPAFGQEQTPVSAAEGNGGPAFQADGLNAVSGCYALTVDTAFHITGMNSEFSSLVASEPGFHTGNLFDVVDERDRTRTADAITRFLAGPPAGGISIINRIRSGNDDVVPIAWHFARSANPNASEAVLIGTRMLQDHEDDILMPDASAAPAFEARLAKQYRFMMKYVPFPIFHVDAETGKLTYGNPAFSTIIGTDKWEDEFLSDFASLEIHEGSGDTRPCTLYVLNPSGITLAFRGILTTLTLYGKTIREIKLDPLE